LAFLLAGLLAMLTPGQSQATVLLYSLDAEFSGGTAPSATPPWVYISMNDFNATGSVQVTITAPGLSATENILSLYMNLAPTLDPEDLTFTFGSKSRAAMTTPTIDTGVNEFKADGDGKYDILFNFAPGGPPQTFVNGDSITYTIGGIASLDVNSFNFNSAPAGGHGPFRMAAHVQNTGGGEASGWIAGPEPSIVVPEPSSLAIVLLGAISAAAWSIVRRRS
jgi:hypothetical protein